MSWKLIRRGKVRDIYEDEDERYIALVATDRVSAFDHVLPVIVHNKGIFLTQISELFMNVTERSVPNAQVFYYNNPEIYEDFSVETGTEIDAVTIQEKLTMLPIEAIVRLYLTGSAWRAYEKGERTICGETMPDGLRESEKFPKILFTPTTKSDDGDKPITMDKMVEILNGLGYDGINLANQIKQASIQNATEISEYCDKCGLILVDTKVEFGLDADGNLKLADENGTFDSSRFAKKEGYEIGKPFDAYDKEIIRRSLREQLDKGIENPVPPQEIIDLSAARYEELARMLGL